MSTEERYPIEEGSPEDERDVADDALPTDEEEAAAPPPLDASYVPVSPDQEEE